MRQFLQKKTFIQICFKWMQILNESNFQFLPRDINRYSIKLKAYIIQTKRIENQTNIKK